MSDEPETQLIGGRYKIERKLGVGGMGAVFLARDMTTSKAVALKVIRDNLIENAEAIARFDREASALRELTHENIVRFYGAGVDNGARWLAMELLEGRTLKERIATRGSLPWAETLPIVRGITAALEAAHARGLIHRDLKPENIMLVGVTNAVLAEGGAAVKLLDFGVAKHTALPEGQTMTGTGMIVGTPGFVAPEVVLHGTSDDPRSDFYGLGATWFEMLTGAKPFDAPTPFALAMRHVNERPPRPTDMRPFSPVPVQVEDLLFRLLAKTPAGRPLNARALLDELDHLERQATQGFDLDDAGAFKTVTDMATPRDAVRALGTSIAPNVTPSTQIASLDNSGARANRLAIAAAAVAIVVAAIAAAASFLRPTVVTPATTTHAESPPRQQEGPPPPPPPSTTAPPSAAPTAAAPSLPPPPSAAPRPRPPVGPPAIKKPELLPIPTVQDPPPAPSPKK